jgi:hypothetical protein
MTLPAGHRFEATQALRQTLARAVEWSLMDSNPAKTGVDNPQPPRREMYPFESDGQLAALAAELGPRYGPMVLFAAATGLRPGEWIALAHRDIDRDDRLVHICRAFRGNRVKPTKTNTARTVPLQRSALEAYMGTSLINIDHSCEHLARDSHQRAIQLLDDCNVTCSGVDVGGRSVDVDSPFTQVAASAKVSREQEVCKEPSDGLEPSTPSLPWQLGSAAADRY